MKKKADLAHMTENMSKAGNQATLASHMATPKRGDSYHCDSCGIEVQVTSDCQCPDHTAFQCCGQEMHKV